MKKGDGVAVLGLVARLVLLRGRWASTVSPTGVAVRLHGAPTTEPCECHAQRHWDCGRKQPRLSFGASGTCWPQLGGASGMLHHTGVVMAPRSGIPGDVSDAATRRGVEETQQPKWTMSSSVKEMLQEGNTSSTNMRLSDFLWNYVGGRAAVDERLQCDDGDVCSGAGSLRTKPAAS
ncbi:putative retrotransposon hot spot protein (RHS) [Trypanosoma cruzi]|uniref:Putative retrotransposon hot spot protein (RHS) n=1 Tax=Trypanosoma cruzi TaxID=5693 RepID=A0A2V2WV11_TRYCR|nr:putative retrotransposon hot spot protein (RHS) [Trypanosoma cruzi]RNC54784.1 retrotransposon hot spot (RHS) protein [Trypanosoma cruzi]